MNRPNTIIFALIFLLAGISSCTITQEYHFNKDMSGSVSSTIDMSQLIDYMNSMDTSNSSQSLDTLDNTFKEAAQELEDMGAENVQFGWKTDEKKVLYINYEFSDIEMLNKISASNEMTKSVLGQNDNPANTIKFETNGRRELIYDAPVLKNDSLSDSDMESIGEMYTFETIFSFDRKIKSLDNDSYTISEDGKSFSQTLTLNDLYSEEISRDFKLKLKFF
ncbi:MAG: hypothetical protein U9N85_12380 [Bacteroidota bacterium]|nr:hypothetical protein [Bacteroidota bacterium]